jgi:ribonuclease-3
VRFIRQIYNYYFHPDRELARRMRTLIGFTPTHLGLFKLAFFHKSTFTSKDYAISNNERLEFLGDAVLSTIVGEYLFKKYPNSDEGFLTKMRSKIVKRNSLDEIADRMGLDLFLANYNQTRLSKSMLGNALEALVGAVYIELGYEGTKRYVVQRILRKYLDIHELERYDDNFKSQLLEWCQKSGRQIEYRVVAKYKSEKRDKFKVAVFVDGVKLGTADDFNKKSAEQLASERAITALGNVIFDNGPLPVMADDTPPPSAVAEQWLEGKEEE